MRMLHNYRFTFKALFRGNVKPCLFILEKKTGNEISIQFKKWGREKQNKSKESRRKKL